MVILIGIAGPSASGKSTICDELQKKFKDSLVIHTDNYWCNPDHFPTEKGFKNWELPQCLDFDTLYANLAELKQGRTTFGPHWVQGIYPPVQKELKPATIIVVEGFRLFWDSRIRKLFDFKIYIDVPEETILHRRAQRMRHPDKPGRELYYQEIVVPEDQKYGIPTKKYADLIVDGRKSIAEIVEVVVDAVKLNGIKRNSARAASNKNTVARGFISR